MRLEKITENNINDIVKKNIICIEKSMSYLNEMCERYDVAKNIRYIVDFNKVTSNMSIATGVGELATKIEEQRNVYDGVAAYNSLPGYVEAINRHLADMGMEGLE